MPIANKTDLLVETLYVLFLTNRHENIRPLNQKLRALVTAWPKNPASVCVRLMSGSGMRANERVFAREPVSWLCRHPSQHALAQEPSASSMMALKVRAQRPHSALPSRQP